MCNIMARIPQLKGSDSPREIDRLKCPTRLMAGDSSSAGKVIRGDGASMYDLGKRSGYKKSTERLRIVR